MGYSEDCTFFELSFDGILYQFVRLHVHSRRGLVQYKNLTLP